MRLTFPNVRFSVPLLAAIFALVSVTPASSSAESGKIEEIEITARKRTEKLQDAPVSVSALSASALQDYEVADLSQLATITPNLTFDTSAPLTGSSSSASVYIRGVGSSEFAAGTDPGVGIYVDGVYLARSIGGVLDVLDPERVEILRGPQGTLFGRNTIGGAINIITPRPESELGGKAAVTIGSDSLSRWQGTLNVPVAESLLTRWSFVRTKQDGWVSNRAGSFSDPGNDDSWAARGTVEWLANESVSLTVRGDVTRESQGVAGNVLVDLFTQGPIDTNTGQQMPSFVGGLVGQICLPVPAPGQAGCQAQVLAGLRADLLTGKTATAGGFTSERPAVNGAPSQPVQPKTELDVWGTSATLDVELSSELLLRSISSYRRLDTFFSLDIDHSDLPILQNANDFDSEQTTQEIQLIGQTMDDRLRYTIGAYYALENVDQKDIVEFLPGALMSGGKVESKATAGFGQATFDATERLQITVGARYSYEKKTFDAARQQILSPFLAPGPDGMLAPIPDPAFQPGAPLVLAEVKSTNRDRALSPHVSAAYFFTEDLMTYVSYSEGFKAGGFQTRIFPPRPFIPKFDNEIARVYEVGLKTTTLDDRLRISAAAFYTAYEDLQIGVFDGIAPILTNAGEAIVRGYEIEGQFLPTPELRLDFALGFTDAQYSEIDFNRTGVSRGNDFAKTPRWSAAAAASYGFDLGGGGSLTTQVGWSYRSDVAQDAFNTPVLSQNRVNLFDASVAWESADADWRVAISARNLTDRTYLVSGSTIPVAGITEATYSRGRTWQVSLERRF